MMTGIVPILPAAAVRGSDLLDDNDNVKPTLPGSVDALGGGDRDRYHDAAMAQPSAQYDVAGSLSGAGSIDDSALRHLMHGLTFQQRHQVYLKARAWVSRRGLHGPDDDDDIEQPVPDGEGSFIDFLALNVALRSMQGRHESSARDQSSIDDLLARRDALWKASRADILQWMPGSETERAGQQGDLPAVAGNTHEFPIVAGSVSALDLLRRLVLPQRGNVSDEWLRQALSELSQPGKRFARGDDTLQQLTALRVAGFALTVRQAYELAGRLDKTWQRVGLPNRMSQLQLTEKVLECAAAPGNVKALCKTMAAGQPAQSIIERAVMTTIYRAMTKALPSQAWVEEGARLKFQDGIGAQLRDMEPKALLSYRRPLETQNTLSSSDKRETDQSLLLWS